MAGLGISGTTAAGPYCEAVSLEAFDIEQIAKALRTTTEEDRKEIVDLARKDEKFFEIVSRPSFLYIVSQLWRKEKLSEFQERINSAFVMDLFIKHSYDRQYMKLREGRLFMILKRNELEFFMNGIASYMAARSLPNQITKDELSQTVSKLYEVIPEGLTVADDIMGTGTSRPLRTRLQDVESAINDVMTDVRACGILVTDLSQSGALRFAHKSFMEFLFAKVTADRLLGTNPEIDGALRAATGSDQADIMEFPESVSFFAELISANIDGESGAQILNEDQIVKKMFQRIVFSDLRKLSYLSLMGRISGISSLTVFSAGGKTRWRRILAQVLNPAFVLIAIVPAFIILSFSLFSDMLGYDTVPVGLSVPMLAMQLLGLGIGFSAMGASRSTAIMRRRIQLWYACCKALDIDDRNISNQFGKSTVEGIRRSLSDVQS